MLSEDDGLSFLSWVLGAERNSCKVRTSPGRTRKSLYRTTRIELRGLGEVGWNEPLEMLYYRAIAEWVRRSDISYHLLKTYDPYDDASVDKAAVELYVRND
jgi:hypothetical protein